MPPRQDLSVEYAWAAGFVDGEGYIALRPQGGTLGVTLVVAQVDRRPLDRLASLFGGNVNGPYKHKSKDHSAYYQWGRWQSNAVVALRAMRPYISTKGEVVDLVLEYHEYAMANNRPGVAASSEVLRTRRDFYDRLLALRHGRYKQVPIGKRLSGVMEVPDAAAQ